MLQELLLKFHFKKKKKKSLGKICCLMSFIFLNLLFRWNRQKQAFLLGRHESSQSSIFAESNIRLRVKFSGLIIACIAYQVRPMN